MVDALTCTECGAIYSDDRDSCATRFDALLALDHARQEPWGSRHGIAFSVFALQHPLRYPASLDGAWRILYRIYVAGDDPARVIGALAGRVRHTSDAWDVPPRPTHPTGAPSMTIAQMGDFAASRYAGQLDQWCTATVSWLSALT